MNDTEYISAWRPISEAPTSMTVIIEERCALYIGDFIEGEWMIHDTDGMMPASSNAQFVLIHESLRLDRAVQFLIAQAFVKLVRCDISGFAKETRAVMNLEAE